MRQAGRYLPEYRKTRDQAGSFLDLCYNSELASEVTLQPIHRFNMDAAILFADILLIPHALGQKVWFVAGEGPRLDPTITAETVKDLLAQYDPAIVAPIFETVRHVRADLAEDKALIGFAGAPWTVATYMIAGGPSKDPSALRHFAYEDPVFIEQLIDTLVQVTSDYLIAQVEAGADALQLFDSWAGGLPESLAMSLSLEPMAAISERVRDVYPDIPIIWFPKGVGALAIEYAKHPLCTAIGIDTMTPIKWARDILAPHAVIQGGLDPLLVVTGGDAMRQSVNTMLDIFSDVPYIFNLGHGFVPETPIEHVAEIMDIIRARG